MVAALVLHSGNDVAGNRGYPMLTIYDYWNCTGAQRCGVHGCQSYWLHCLKEVGHYFLLA